MGATGQQLIGLAIASYKPASTPALTVVNFSFPIHSQRWSVTEKGGREEVSVAKFTLICHRSPVPAHAVSLAIATPLSAMGGWYIEINTFVFVTLET